MADGLLFTEPITYLMKNENVYNQTTKKDETTYLNEGHDW